ncbi:class I adenylate-forming enzyme family protein [Streptosporangium saharense]|uniref:class I adenylate-forming enzyme family protein n=1 Tax=Streptosporangium saharense TaxID=1706840 RepID=UPI0036980238
MPVALQVARHASEHPRRIAVRAPGGDLSYVGLASRMEAAAGALRGRGIGHGALAALSLADPADLLVAVLAADLAGATPLICDPTWDPVRRERIMEAVPADVHIEIPLVRGRSTAVVSDGVHVEPPLVRERITVVAPDGIRTPPARGPGRHERIVAGEPVSVPVPAASPSDRAWACFSSGSTGRPRAVVRTRASWTGSFPHLSALAGIGPGDVVLVPGPLTSSLYGFAAVHALAVGATVVVPGRWSTVELAAHLDEATAIHVVPHRLPAVLDLLEERRGRLRTAVVGGAALGADARERAARAGIDVLAYYGATELSFVAADTDGQGLRPFPEVEIQVRAAPGQPFGEVWARSPWLAEGYLAGGTGPLRIDGDGWATVGDVAEPYRMGEVLRLRGRGDGAIQTGGATVVPEDVEEVLRKAPGVGDVVVVGSPHPELGSVVTAIIEADGLRRPSRAALEEIARGGLDAAQRPRRWYTVRSLPRTPAGKPARGLLAARLAGGDPDIRRLT